MRQCGAIYAVCAGRGDTRGAGRGCSSSAVDLAGVVSLSPGSAGGRPRGYDCIQLPATRGEEIIRHLAAFTGQEINGVYSRLAHCDSTHANHKLVLS